MRSQWRQGLRRLAAGAAACCCCGLLAGSTTIDDRPGRPWRAIQLNLCNSGYVGCYTGRSVVEASAVIRAQLPDLVTLNEICGDDVPALHRALAGSWQTGVVVSAFQPVGDRRAGGPYLCRNGEPYGIGLLARLVSRDPGYTTDGGLYPIQDLRDPEQRAWLCLHAAGRITACATHLTDTVPAITLAQCRYLLTVIVPSFRSRHGNPPAVLAGDLNLGYGGPRDVRACFRPGYQHAELPPQYVLATAGYRLGSVTPMGLRGSTDHPGMLVVLSPR